jgi:hypothetical protein
MAQLKKPKKPKMPKRPKASASNSVLENYLKKVAEKKKKYQTDLTEYNKAVKKRETLQKQIAKV